MRAPLVDVNVIAERLGAPRWRVYDLVARGVLPSVKLGRHVRFDEQRVEEWLAGGGAGLREEDQ